MTNFKNRVFGAAIVKAINSNYNADFTGLPRTLPNGVVYATDKAFKYTIKNYIKDNYSTEYVLYFKRMKKDVKNNEIVPFDLIGAYDKKFDPNTVKGDKPEEIAKNLLKCIDIRLFGATFAPKGDGAKGKNISIHGTVQINHGVNIWKENNIFSEQITAPFRNPNPAKEKNEEGESKDKGQTTIGQQSKLEEGHYLHHFSINPKNLEDAKFIAGKDANDINSEDINILKEAMRRGATYYDSASKAGTENEFLLWIELKETSKTVLPNLNNLVKMKSEKQDGKVVLDLAELSKILNQFDAEIEKIEIYRNESSLIIENKPDKTNIFVL
ncbi:MAG: type I CRISPR-associated protein Cas7 [Bacteroidota bacterium]